MDDIVNQNFLCCNAYHFNIKRSHNLRPYKEKYSSFQKRRWLEKFSPGWPQFFLKWFSRDILFPSLVFFAFFDSCFSCLFVGFWNQKCIFWYTFNYAGRWLIKFFSPNRFQETRLLVFSAWPAHSDMKTVTSSPFHFFHFTKYLIPQ